MAKLTRTATTGVTPVLNTDTVAASVTIPVIYLGTEGDDYMNFYGSSVPTYNRNGGYLGAIFTGYGGNDVMLGSHGNDVMGGGEGNDFFKGFYGNDILQGGNDTDTADYRYYGHHVYNRSQNWGELKLGVIIDLESGYSEGRRSTILDNDTLSSVENVIGSDYNDIVYASNVANDVRAGSGDDYVFGYGGNDVLSGENGNDVISGGTGDDLMTGGLGFDRLVGNEDSDTAIYLYSAVGFTIDLGLGTATGNALDSDTLVDIENVTGSNFNDSISGTGGANRLSGQGGNDVLFGLGGDDQLSGGNGDDALIGGAGADVLNGGQGFDAAEYGGSVAGVIVNLWTGLGSGGDAEGDVLTEIEKVVGSSQGDIIRGNFANNKLFGGDSGDTLDGDIGNDQLYGGEGGDLIGGGEGNDFLQGDGAADSMDGGAGIDSAGYVDSDAAVQVNLALGTGLGGDAEGDILQDIENLQGSVFDDVLTGDGNNNFLSGFFGDDSLDGAAGHDHLIGFDGDDILLGRAGNDMLEGGWGVDRINGGTGDDFIIGNEGADILTGGSGFDRFVFLLTADSNTNNGIDRVSDFTQGQDLIDLGGVDANAVVPFDSAFTFVGNSSAPLAVGALRFSYVGGNTLIEAEIDGQGGVDLTILLTGTINLTAADFVL